MNSLIKKVQDSPTLVRVVPFVLFVLMTYLQGKFGESSRYWVYLGKSVIGIGFVAFMYPFVKEMRWAFSWEAVVVGVAVCVMWIGIDDWYPKFGPATGGWNPHAQYGKGSGIAWACVVGRILASSIIVPPLEEVFYRSFFYRYLINVNFLKVPFGVFNLLAFVVTAVVFGFSHYEWLAGILCAFAYQGLAIHKRRLGDAMFAHGITNFLLGVWIVWKGDWHFW